MYAGSVAVSTHRLVVARLTNLVPAVIVGIILGPISAKFLSAGRWGSAEEGQQEAITLVCSQYATDFHFSYTFI